MAALCEGESEKRRSGARDEERRGCTRVREREIEGDGDPDACEGDGGGAGDRERGCAREMRVGA